jgi:hypothetical protein
MFSISFWKTAAENALTAGASAFTGSLVLTTTPTLKGLEAAAVAAGVGALYAFVKQVGGVQATSAVVKVAPK